MGMSNRQFPWQGLGLVDKPELEKKNWLSLYYFSRLMK